MNAQQSLEVGLSYNFEVRDHPIYHLINAKVMKTNGNMEDAIKTLQVALNLVHKRKKGSAGAGNKVIQLLIDENEFMKPFNCT